MTAAVHDVVFVRMNRGLVIIAGALLLGGLAVFSYGGGSIYREEAAVAPAQAPSQTPAPTPLPADVEAFVERRDGCDHFRGEEPYEKQRAAFLDERVATLCQGTDVALSDLRQKYADQPQVIARLKDYEDSIENN